MSFSGFDTGPVATEGNDRYWIPFREGSVQKRASPMIQKTHTGYLHSWIIQSKVTPLTLQLSACEHKCLSTWKHWQGWDLSDHIAHPYSQGWIFKCWEKGETLAVAKVYIYLLLFGMTNFTPQMTHTISVFDLIAFVIMIINDNNSTAVMPQGPSWDQGSVLIGTEHAEKRRQTLPLGPYTWAEEDRQNAGRRK